MHRVLILHYLLSVSVHVCSQDKRTPIHKQLPEMPPSSLFTFCILSGALIQKTRTLRMTDHRRLWRELPLRNPPTPLPSTFFFCSPILSPLPERSLSLPERLPPPSLPSPPATTPPPLPWQERVASECQMYYRVSHGNVNIQPCHESRVVWPPLLLYPPSFLSSLPSLTALAARRVEKVQNS